MSELDISIAGEINLDLILYGLPATMPTDCELLASQFQLTLGSSSAILAHNLAVLGAKVGFITRSGSDELGSIAVNRLTATGVELSRIIRTNGLTSTGLTNLLAHDQTWSIAHLSGHYGRDVDYLASATHFHLSSLFLQRSPSESAAAFSRSQALGLTISLDTNDDPDDKWDGALAGLIDLVDVLLPNEAEACRIARRDTLNEALEWLSPHVPTIVVKCGSHGAFIQHGRERIVVDPIAVQSVDTVSAGESFNAEFLYAWLRDFDLRTCGMAGNISGLLSTMRPGGPEAFRDPAFWKSFLKEHGFPGLE